LQNNQNNQNDTATNNQNVNKDIKIKINKDIKDKIKYIKLLVNSRHKLNKSIKGKKYIKIVDNIVEKYKNNLDKLIKLDKKISVLQNKLARKR
jgi:hypothetical protein